MSNRGPQTNGEGVVAAMGVRSVVSSADSNGTARERHRCYLCDRTYERHDHLSRHLKSHDNERNYRCGECGKGFNRADLLNRHRTAHAKAAAGETVRRRAGKACKACISAKTKCDDERPCKRCRTRNFECRDSDSRTSYQDRPSLTGDSPSPGSQEALRSVRHSIDMSEDLNSMAVPIGAHFDINTPGGGHVPFPDADALFLSSNLQMDDFNFPGFFEQIMMPSEGADFTAQSNITIPPDVSNFTRDYNFGALDLDFNTFLTPEPFPSPRQVKVQNGASAGHGPPALPASQSEVESRSKALEKSPWSWSHWIPPRNANAFTGHEEFAVPEEGISPADHLTPNAGLISYRCGLRHKHRDAMLNLAAQIAINRITITSFPSLELLQELIDVYLVQEVNGATALVHPPTLCLEDSERPELLLAMVSAGATLIAHAPTWRMGLLLQELVRLAIGEAMERNNSLTRELWTVQAWCIFLDVGIWSGFRRKAEIASSFLQPLYCMFSWSHSFSKHKYKDIRPSPQDDDALLHEKWKAWVEQEARKRGALHIFIHDAQVAFIQLRNPLIACGQMQLPAPASRDLWLAPDARTWRDRFLAAPRPTQADTASIVEIFADLSALNRHEGWIDKRVCALAACFAVAHDVWEFRQQATLLRHRSKSDLRDRKYGYKTWQRDLLDDLEAMRTYCELEFHGMPSVTLMIEFLIMSLHVSLEDIQVFSGRNGEEEARKAYPIIRDWSESVEARCAVWHAGQVFRIARSFEKTQLRDFYAIAVYDAALVLWIYGMVSSKARRSGVQTPVKSQPNNVPINRQPVFLDAADEKSAQAFKLLGHGLPGLRSYDEHSLQPNTSRQRSVRQGFCALQNARGVMGLAADVLKSNFPQSSHGLPPLIENLTSLITELASLPV